MLNSPKITHIGTAVPDSYQTQEVLADQIGNFHSENDNEKRVLNFLYKRSHIEKRHAVLDHFGTDLLPAQLEQAISLPQKMDTYKERALPLCIEAIKNTKYENTKDLTHVIAVTCTGLSAPGLEYEIATALGLTKNVQKSAINFMGCYAAIHGLKQADQILARHKDAKILLVCVELCSLHFSKEKSIDNITATLLFADGAAAVVVQNTDARGIGLKNFYSEVLPNTDHLMGWKIKDRHFGMILSDKIADALKSSILNFNNEMLTYYQIESQDVAYWAIHPGGKSIVDTMKSTLSLHNEQISSSYEVLREYGNMSSPTILFVLAHIKNKLMDEQKNEANIVGLAFGPGLTIESFYAKYE